MKHIYRFLLGSCACLLSVTGYAQDTYNYIRTTTVRVAGKTTQAQVDALTASQRQQTITYFDGLGRPMQIVEREGSPGKKDVVQPIEYDAYGREAKKYLPYTYGTTGDYKPNALKTPGTYTTSDQYLFHQSAAAGPGKRANTAAPYAVTVFEASPLNRVTKQGAAGTYWQPDADGPATSDDRTIKIIRRTNTANEVRLWKQVSGNWQVPGYYADQQLYVTETRDEHQKITLEYQDKVGRVVLKKVQVIDAAPVAFADYLHTYYVYDDLGNLRLVVPPKAVELTAASSTWAPSSGIINNLCFSYTYDERQRLIVKTEPGVKPVYMVYNQRDELIMRQDGEQRKSNTWSFYKYDALGRQIMMGNFTETRTHAQLQAAAKTYTVQFESRSATTGDYTLTNAFPNTITSGSLRIVTYYDDYNYPDLKNSALVFAPQGTHPDRKTSTNSRVKGQVTGQKIKVLEVSKHLVTANYYDEEYRLIQTIGDNNLGGKDRLTNVYDFAGQLQETILKQTKGTESHTAQTDYDYDHAGRLLETRQIMDGGPQVILARNEYNELGQLVDKGLHSTNKGASFLQSVDYRYNMRGWLTSINNSTLTSDNNATNNETNDVFGFELFYNTGTMVNTNVKPQYNGNIAQVQWKTARDRVQRKYGYQYDAVNRLKAAYYTTQNTNAENYNVSDITYDANGNLTHMQRTGVISYVNGKKYGMLDDLTYYYNYTAYCNKLRGADDTQVTDEAHDFEDKGGRKYSRGDEFAYDENASLVRDDNKGITNILYNHLNLPRRIYFGSTSYIDLLYTATGAKLRKTVVENGATVKVVDYGGPFQYEGASATTTALQFAHTAEGRALYQGGTWKYEYHLKDHLGNLRVAFAEAPTTTMMATMEEVNAPQEDTTFTNVKATRKQDRGHARTGQGAARLSAKEGVLLGPGKRVAMEQGDSLTVEVYGLYEQDAKTNVVTNLAAWLVGNAAASAVPAAPQEGGQPKQGKAFPYLSAGIAIAPQIKQQEKGIPQAYLQYIAYDSVGNYLSSKHQLLDSEAKGNWKKLQLTFTATEPSYVEVFVATESSEEVYFDDMAVSTATSIIVQDNSYDPWGLNLVGIHKDGNPDHKFQYNGKEKQTELGLNWIDYGARMYDPQLGRWHVADPMADQMPQWSPYNYTFNNPIIFTDPDGTVPDITIYGDNNSSVTVKTDLVDVSVDASSLGIDFGGNYTLSGNDILVGALDIVGVFDPSPASDVLAAGLSAKSGDYWGAAACVAGAAIPYAGDFAKTGKVTKAVNNINDGIKAADKVKDTSRAARREAMRDAGIPTSQPLIPDKAVKSKDKVYTTRDKRHTVQDAKNDRSHKGESHWEAGPTKKDASKPDGLNRSGNNNKPQMGKPKSKVYYNE